MEQRRANENKQTEKTPRKHAVDLTMDDDDFYDLPPYEPHVPTPKASKRPKAPKAPKVHPGKQWQCKFSLSLGRALITLAAALAITAIVVTVAHWGTLPIDPPSEGDATPSLPSVPDSDADEIASPPPFPTANYTVDVSAFLSAIEYLPEKKDILLLNKQHPVGENYRPETLVTLPAGYTYSGKSIQLDATAATALQAMMLCMRASGITDTYVTSGYRNYTYQTTLFEHYILEEMQKNESLTREQAIALVQTYSSRPGESEHQSGLCVDLMTIHMTDLVNEQFETTAAFQWLQENAAEFGFILRYPKDKTEVTGYSYESWHYRFVGRAAALEMTTRGITLEEYLGETP